MLVQIDGFDGYFVSDDGRVYSNLGQGNRNRNKRVPMYEIKPRYTKTGYARVCMRDAKTGHRVDRYIHRLVAEAFLKNPENKRYVNHINCVRSDNVVENLEWVTAKENTDYTMTVGHVSRNEAGQYLSQFAYIHAPDTDCIVYSPNKYRETEGSKDIGTNDWNQGRVQEIKERVLHL